MSGAAGSEAQIALRGLYKRLLERGEDKRMLRRAISVHPMDHNIKTARKFLAHHRRVAEIAEEQRALRFFQVFRRVKLAAQLRRTTFALFRMRLAQASWAALSDLLIYVLCGSILFVLYQMYRVCRVGLTKAEEKYEMLAIPIIQTIEALELTEQRRKGASLRREMDGDIVRERSKP